MYTRAQLEEWYQIGIKFKRPNIYNYLNSIIGYDLLEDKYEGMLLAISLFLILDDANSGQAIFSGIQYVWMRNASIVILERMLGVLDNPFAEIDDLGNL